MTCGIWNVKSLHREGSPVTVSKELSKYMLDLVGVQEVRWDGSGTEQAKGMITTDYIQASLCIRESYQQLKHVEFVSYRMSYTVLEVTGVILF
jgi:hypothetical protein